MTNVAALTTVNVTSPTEAGAASPPTARVVRVLEHFARRPVEPVGLAEVARALELSKTTAHAILNTLVELGWLTRDDASKSYALAPGLVALGRAAERGYPAVATAAAELAPLAERHDLTVSVAAVLDDEIRVLEAAVPASRADGVVHAGMAVPFAPPFGSVFAASGPASRTRQWLDRVPPGARAAQEDVLRSVVGRGYAVERLNETSRRIRAVLARLAALEGGREAQQLLAPLMAELATAEEVQLPDASGAFAVDIVSVPVLDRFGHAALSITAQVDGMVTHAALERLAGDLRDAAARVGAAIAGPAA